jgi:hypothetical protein
MAEAVLTRFQAQYEATGVRVALAITGPERETREQAEADLATCEEQSRSMMVLVYGDTFQAGVSAIREATYQGFAN